MDRDELGHAWDESASVVKASELAPWQRVSWLSRVTFHWMTSVMRGEVQLQQVLPVARCHSYVVAGRHWGDTTRFRAFLSVYRRAILRGLAVAVLVFAIQFFIVMFLFQQLALYLSDPTAMLGWGLALCCVMLVANVLQNFCFAFAWVENLNFGILAKVGFMAVVVDKAVRLLVPSEAKVVNLITNDSERIFEMAQYFLWVMAAPLQVATSCALICSLLGWPGVPCFAIVVTIIVVNRSNGLAVGKIRRRALPVTDQRLGFIQELVAAVKVVKIYCFEQSLSEAVLSKRSVEIATLKSANLLASLTATLVQGNAMLVPMVCFVLYVGAVGPLTVATAFTVLALVNGLWFPMHMLGLGMTRVGVGIQSFARLEAYLAEPEMQLPVRLPMIDNSPHISIARTEFRRDETFSVLVDELQFGAGLHMVVGAIGSGKSTLLCGALGLLPRVGGAVEVRGEAAYAAQTAFVVHASLRENIVFGETGPWSEERYRAAVAGSCLEADLAALPDGDRTEVGEKGTNLSGGQRQRLSVARALYSNRPVLVLDDCLSAVDVRVGKQMFSQLQQMAASGRVVLLANHQLQYCAAADQIVVLQNGRVAEKGSFYNLEKAKGLLSAMLEDYGHEEDKGNKNAEHGGKKTDVLQSNAKATGEPVFVLVKAEGAVAGRVGGNVWWSYLRAGGWLFAASGLAMCVYMAGRSFTDFWLAYYISGNTFHVSYSVWAGVYGGIVGFGLITFYFSDLQLFWSCLTASQRLHDASFRNLLRGTMQFFDTTPIGRILNRFSKDVDAIDNQMPFAMEQLVIYALQSLSIFVAIAVVSPFILVTFPPMFVLFFWIARFLRNSNRQSRRLLAVCKSLVLTSISTAMSGIDTIRAFSRTENWLLETRIGLDRETAAQYFAWLLGRWFNLRLDLIISFLVFFTSIIAVSLRNGALGALAISYTIRLASAFQWSIRNALDVEAQMVAVERLLEYADKSFPMEPEGGATEPPASWPEHGQVCFENVSVWFEGRRSEKVAPVLNAVTFDVPGGASMGVVGRTGAGKTTVMNCLLRLIPYEGTIRIDGIDISQLSLSRLRKAISVIPQESVVFLGSLRKNLDPAGERTDADIEDTMRALRLEALCGRLDEPLAELSQGQRQLLCIARAVLRGGRLLVSDESTASIDTATDQHIQRFLEGYTLDRSVTSLTIAHRLQTVIGSDLVLVLERGRVAEFGATAEVAGAKGKFRAMIEDTGHSSSMHLLAMVSQRSLAKNLVFANEQM